MSKITVDRAVLEQALEALEHSETTVPYVGFGMAHREADRKHEAAITALRAALAQETEPTVKESLQVPPSIADAMTAADLAWLETRRLVRVWEELGQMRWAGADEGWDKAIEKVRNRLDKECQDVLAWKGRVEASGETAVQLLQRMKHD